MYGLIVMSVENGHNQFKVHKNHFCSRKCANKYVSDSKSVDICCEFCGKKFKKRRSSKKRFCSVTCQNEWQKTNTGKKNPKYTRQKHNCDYCGREHIVKAYKINNKNLFCSTECRQKWFADIWSQNEEWKNESRERAVKILSDGIISKTNSKPQVIIDSILDELSVNYQREYPSGYYSIDNFLSDYNLCIEVMGDFWHASPVKYAKPKYEKQTKTVHRDIQKRKYVKDNIGCEILYLWESDIINNKNLCTSLIKLYIHSNGVLPNYHSFNYFILNDLIFPSNNKILALQDTML